MDVLTDVELDRFYDQLVKFPDTGHIVIDNKLLVSKDFMLKIINSLKRLRTNANKN